MGYFDSTGFVAGEGASLAASAARTTAGSGPAVNSEQYTIARLTLNVTAVAAGTTATVTVETSGDGTTWTSVGTFAGATAAGTQRKVFAGLDRLVRASWTLAGTAPSATFSVSGSLL
jgi:hypothetical protein